jgi:hypothetical protein
MLLEQINRKLDEHGQRVRRLLRHIKPRQEVERANRAVRNVAVGPRLLGRLTTFATEYGFASVRQATEALLTYALEDAEVLLRDRRVLVQRAAGRPSKVQARRAAAAGVQGLPEWAERDNWVTPGDVGPGAGDDDGDEEP